jgi:hypothetical protein
MAKAKAPEAPIGGPPSQPGWTPWSEAGGARGGRPHRISVLDREWMKFEGRFAGRSKKHKIGLGDIPFPPPAALEFLLKRDLEGNRYKKLALRWHPDKFAQRCGGQLVEEEREAILDRVKGVFQLAHSALAGSGSYSTAVTARAMFCSLK